MDNCKEIITHSNVALTGAREQIWKFQIKRHIDSVLDGYPTQIADSKGTGSWNLNQEMGDIAMLAYSNSDSRQKPS